MQSSVVRSTGSSSHFSVRGTSVRSPGSWSRIESSKRHRRLKSKRSRKRHETRAVIFICVRPDELGGCRRLFLFRFGAEERVVHQTMSTYAQQRPVAGNTIRIDCVTAWPSFEALRAEWTDLLARSRSDCVFLTHEWLSGWWKHLSDGRELHILTARNDGRLVGILPLAIRPRQVGRMMPKVLEFLGTGIVGSDYLDAIVDHDFEREALDAFAGALASSGFMIQFSQLRESGTLAEEIAGRLADSAWKVSPARINV